MIASQRTTNCCIVGGGPAGMMLGLLLARAGIEVLVLEKHRDFFRDFRGDTIHPSTLDLIDQLGLRQQFDAVPHTEVGFIDLELNGARIRPVDLRHLHGANRHITLMPQWDFLDLLADEAAALPTFQLLTECEVTGLLWDGSRVAGVVATTPTGEVEIRASLTVAADGRASVVRAESGLIVREFGVPIDVLWFRLPLPQTQPSSTFGYVDGRSMLITIPRLDYFQTAMLIPKGGFEAVQQDGLPAFRATIARVAPFLATVAETLRDWEQVKLLSVQINQLRKWHLPGLLCIGDAAHAMSPAFGVGINYAVQDAVAAANLLSDQLRDGTVTEHDLAAVQRRRQWPASLMQRIQLTLHNRIARPGAIGASSQPPGTAARIVLFFVLPIVRRVGARVIGRGFKPERIRPELLDPDLRDPGIRASTRPPLSQ